MSKRQFTRENRLITQLMEPSRASAAASGYASMLAAALVWEDSAGAS